MTERQILFSAPMVRALLAGTKTQTRRVVKPQPPADKQRSAWYEPGIMGWAPPEIPSQHWHRVRYPYGQPSDRLWVRETWAKPDMRSAGFTPYVYAAEWPDADRPKHRWRPSIHMPRSASRITLEVTGVRVERLQDISEADSVAEGIPAGEVSPPDAGRFAYRLLWEQINGPGSWDANPWVWVVLFRRAEENHG